MVIYDQLRISDDGQSLFIDAHVNKASYFDNVYIKRMTICTENQVHESDPQTYGSDNIYQKDISEINYPIQSVYPKTQVLSDDKLMQTMMDNGGWFLNFPGNDKADTYCLSVLLSGKFSALDSSCAPVMVVATEDYDPFNSDLNDEDILVKIEGTQYSEKGHTVWQFKGKGDILLNSNICFYLYKQTSSDVYSYVRLDATDNQHFLHFYWQPYYVLDSKTVKEIHLVLNKYSFNENFNKADLSHNMFFVYVECEGVVDPSTPCKLDEMTTLGVTFDYGVFFNQAMNYTKNLVNTCEVSQQFIDFILNVEALKMSLETEHFVPAINYWKRLLNESSNTSLTKPCGCHG